MNKTKKGFTLIELLVSITLMALILVGSASLFYSSLKGKKKTESLTYIKQKGSYALQFMVPKIRNAKDIQSCSQTTISIINQDDTISTINCNPASHIITFDTENLITEGVTACNFVCNISSIPKTITLSFTLVKGSASDILGYTSQDFKTTVSLRTY